MDKICEITFDNEKFRQILDHLPNGFAYHKIVTNESGAAVDYTFLYINDAFSVMTGLEREETIGRRVTEVIPGIAGSDFDWIGIYAEVASKRSSISFRQHSQPLRKWFDVTAFSDREGYFSTIFREITKDVEEMDSLEELLRISENSLKDISESTVYGYFTDAAMKISGAKYAAFNLYNEYGTQFVTVQYAGIGKEISKVIKAIGFDPKGKVWDHDDRRAEKIAEKQMTEFSDLSEVVGNVIDPVLIRRMSKLFNIGKVYICKIMNENMMLGDFTIFMSPGESLRNGKYVEILSGHAGQYLERVKTKKDLQNRTEELEDFFNVNLDLLCIADTDGNFIRLNRAWSDILGYGVNELAGRKFLDFVHPEDIPATLMAVSKLSKQEMIVDFVNRYRGADGNYRWIEWRSNPKGKLIYAAARDITERIKAEEQNRFISTVMMNVYDAVIVADRDFKMTYVNRSTEILFGYRADEMTDRSVRMLYAESDIPKLHKDVFPLISSGEIYNGELINRRKDGTLFVCDLKVTSLKDSDGKPYSYIGIQRDVTDRKKMIDDLKESNIRYAELAEKSFLEQERFKTTLLSVSDAIIAVDRNLDITVMNNVAEYLTGWSFEEVKGFPLKRVFKITDDRSGAALEDPGRDVLLTAQVVEYGDRTMLLRTNGETIPVEGNASPILGSDGYAEGVVIVFRDYTEKREKQRKIEYLSFHDHLTGLYNRRYLDDAVKRLDVSINYPFAVLVVDVNGLKLINDSYGHEAGDSVLIKAAELLRLSCREDSIIARTGGDEFVVLHPHTDAVEAEAITTGIMAASDRNRTDPIIVSLAAGHAVKIDSSEDFAEILKIADSNMYRNKIEQSRIMRKDLLSRIFENINSRYIGEKTHVERVTHFSVALAESLGMSDEDKSKLILAASFHDIGKIAIAADILNKPGPLSSEERREVQKHSVAGYNILKGVEEYAGIAEIVLFHHERWDGKGYPNGYAKDDIPLMSRVIAVADAFEAMTSDRPYRKAMSAYVAAAEIERGAGSQFDPGLAKVFAEQIIK